MASKGNDPGPISGPFEPHAVIADLGGLPDENIDVGRAALALGALCHEGISVGRYLHHLNVLGQEVGDCYASLCRKGAQDNARTRLDALKAVLHERYDYQGDRDSPDDLQNASLIRVIDRARGGPVPLCILYIDAARAQGWEIAGLDIPGHFLCRIEGGGQRIIFDPYDGARVIEAQDIREIVKRTLGPQAELSSAYYEPVSNRDILIRLQNTIKFRQIEIEDYAAALKTVQEMRQIDPGEYRLLLDEGVLLARTGERRAAIDSLAAYIERAPNSRDRMEAELLIQQLHDDL